MRKLKKVLWWIFGEQKAIIKVLYQITNDMAECNKNKKEKNEAKSFIYQQISGDYR